MCEFEQGIGIVQFIGDLVVGVVVERMVEELVRCNRFAGRSQLQGLMGNVSRGVIGAEDREGEQGDGDQHHDALQRGGLECAPARCL